MEKKYTFDKEVEKYEKYRPKYSSELFSKIFNFSDLSKNSKVIEVGCGTGQATEAFVKTGAAITSIELGENLADYVEKKFQGFDNFKVINSSFEAAEVKSSYFDLMFAATSFHWIKEEEGYPRIFDVLKPGGTVALFWNKPSIEEPGGKLDRELQSIYAKHVPHFSKPPTNVENKERYEYRERLLHQHGFNNVEFHLFYGERVFDSDTYLKLLDTYSDHIALDEKVKKPFYEDLKKCLKENGDRIKMVDTMELYLGKKPE